MKKDDFFNEPIAIFSDKHHFPSAASLSIVYYEWNENDNKWVKLRENDPEPNQLELPTGKFDGQIIEVER